MVYKNFRLGLIIRTVLLGGSIFFSFYSFNKSEWYVTTVVSAIISISLMIEIIRFAERYKRSLYDFLISIKSRDFVSSANVFYSKKNILHEAYRIILDEFKNVRIDKEIHYNYLRTLIEHIKTALLSFDNEGRVDFINKTASELLNISANQNISKIESIDKNLYHIIKSIKSGENELVKLKIKDELLHLSIYATELKILKKRIKLISIQNIKTELEYQELESWQKLIRVLTHEIMNSVTPISSLSSAINETIEETGGQKSELIKLSDNDFEDMISSLKTIENRSKGLLKFVSSYKQLTRIPKPDFSEVNLNELINHCKTLLKQKLNEHHIELSIVSEHDRNLCFADYEQIEQVIINLLINAIDAVKDVENPRINIIIAKKDSHKHRLIISDNGKGIDTDEIDKIFIPFYTTKKEGSGIGLSLSRQIIRLHKGTIHVNSKKGIGTEFILEF